MQAGNQLIKIKKENQVIQMQPEVVKEKMSLKFITKGTKLIMVNNKLLSIPYLKT